MWLGGHWAVVEPRSKVDVRPLVQAARDYLSAGLAVIALAGKAPNAAIHRHGLREPLAGIPDPHDPGHHDCAGCSDDAMLAAVFTHPDTTGVGIVIQYPCVVVDIDGPDGADELFALTGTTDLGDTPVAKTSRGLHVWYGFEGLTEPQRTAKLGTRLDLKGVGGYVAAPPSVHPSGHVYEWLEPLAPSGVLRPPLALPDGVIGALTRQAALAAEYRPLRSPNQPASLDALVRHVRHLEEGNRNNGLHWAASAAAEDGFAFEEAQPRLLEAALAAGLDRQEAMTSIRSAYRRPR